MPSRKGTAAANAAQQRKPSLASLAKKNFGFTSFRPGQKEAIETVLAGRDCLVVMPTGSGKSAIYQVAGAMLEGATVVVSPLIALQKDQVDAINASDGPDAVVINSAQRVAESRAAVEKIETGEGKYVFLAPEQLHKQETLDMLQAANISLFVVDEAHCISEWGHDFRPDYLQLGPVVERLGHPVVLAMTATASPEVRDEIVHRLGLRDPKVFVHGFDRPNIHLRVDRFERESEKLEALVRRVNWAEKPGIVYVATRKNAEAVCAALKEDGVAALYYHAGLKASERTDIQEQFMASDSEVIVATNAFGMGVDKPNVRFVYHFDISDSLDSMYQEIGRSGRDGEKAEAVLFFRPEDMGIQKFHSGETKLEPEDFEKVAEAIAKQHGPVEAEELEQETELSAHKLTKAIHRLEDVGVLEVLPTGEVEIEGAPDLTAAAEAAAEEQDRRKQIKQERLRHLQEYVDTGSCRREHLLRYFGDSFEGPCGNCDNCQAKASGSTEDIRVDPNVGTRREVA